MFPSRARWGTQGISLIMAMAPLMKQVWLQSVKRFNLQEPSPDEPGGAPRALRGAHRNWSTSLRGSQRLRSVTDLVLAHRYVSDGIRWFPPLGSRLVCDPSSSRTTTATFASLKEMPINLSTLLPNCAKSNMMGCIDPSVVPDNPFKSLRLLNPGTSGRAARLHMVAFGCSLATQRHITRSGLHQSGQNMGLANWIWALQPQPRHPCGYLIVGILGSPPPALVCERGTASTWRRWSSRTQREFLEDHTRPATVPTVL